MPLRVAILLQHWILGGAERQAIHVARALRDRGHQVELWSLEVAVAAGAPVRDLAVAARLPVIDVGAHRAAALRVAHVATRLMEGRIDVLLPFTVTPNLVAAAAWRLGGARGTLWNQRDAHLSLGAMRVAVARLAGGFVANSAHIAAEIPRAFDVDPRAVRLIPNIVAPSSPRADRGAWRQRLNLDGNADLITALARLHPGKRLDLAIRALARVRSASVLALAGTDQGAERSLRALAAELGVTERVRFLGHVDDVAGLLAATDAGIFTSGRGHGWGEGTSNAVLETVAAGVPCVCVDDVAVRDLVDPRWIAEVEPAALAAAIDDVLATAASREQAAALGAVLRARHSAAAIVPQWEAALEASMNPGPG